MLEKFVELCTSGGGLFWLTLGSDLSIALAYFAIPVTMAIVLRDRKDDIPYPWLWLLFVTFIIACGMTHIAHVWAALSGTSYLEVHAGVGFFCALVSVGAVAVKKIIIHQIKQLPSPKQQQIKLEFLVAQRTAEKDQLIREINHRVGNQLQIIRSMISVETRRADGDEALALLGRLSAELNKMADEHIRRSQADYLRYGMEASGGTVEAAVNRQGAVAQIS